MDRTRAQILIGILPGMLAVAGDVVHTGIEHLYRERNARRPGS